MENTLLPSTVSIRPTMAVSQSYFTVKFLNSTRSIGAASWKKLISE